MSNQTIEGHSLHVRFYKRAVKNEAVSILEQRPIFEDRDYVRIEIPGNQNTVIDTLVEDYHIASYPVEWARYQLTLTGDSGITGTPLTEWSLLSPATAENLRHYKFHTVEQVAGSSDAALMAIGMVAGMSGYELRDQAKYYLAKAREQAGEVKQLMEVDALKQSNELAAEQIAQLQAQVAQLAANAPKKRVRNRKPKEVNTQANTEVEQSPQME